MRCWSKCRNIQKPAINMHVSLSLQFTKQLVILPSYKRAVEATDCFDTQSGFRFTVHNKHMSRFKIKSSEASTFSFTSSAEGARMQSRMAALWKIITHENCKSKFVWTRRTGTGSKTAVQCAKFTIMDDVALCGHKYGNRWNRSMV